MNDDAPDDDPRRNAILTAAAELFIENGFANTSIDAIIERVGGSKRTIYALFGNKTGLFEAIMRAHATRLFDESGGFDAKDLPLPERLERFATKLLRLIAQPRTIGIYRLVASEAGRFPELGRLFRDLGPRQGRVWLAQVIAQAAQAGEIKAADPDAAARQFLGLLRSDLLFDLMLGLRATPDDDEIADIAHAATTVFLHGVSVD
ncbi:TetR/AcrR family transcriptional regulator [Paracoccus sp. Z330]|uniref:TetR/AcrR family transcriptional regulator n=1 Tax=Paracoccus onchidii TaxID=3017813 RepID=A0ABT4ZK63_9RHOB|nr:TetR/AcrR family transcriptional regulator [Paracoccus onchidii]MDB6179100.1 TetR/AcrR family transcriptional regulator [Paracoccus onchidii]